MSPPWSFTLRMKWKHCKFFQFFFCFLRWWWWWWYGMGIMGKKRQNWSRSLCLIKPLAMGFSRIRPTLHLMWALIQVNSFALGLYHIWKRWVHQIMQILWTSCIYAEPISSTTLDNPTIWLIKSLSIKRNERKKNTQKSQNIQTSWVGYQWFFFGGQFCDIVAIIHRKILVKFGYKLNMKLQKFKHSSICLDTLLEPGAEIWLFSLIFF